MGVVNLVVWQLSCASVGKSKNSDNIKMHVTTVKLVWMEVLRDVNYRENM